MIDVDFDKVLANEPTEAEIRAMDTLLDYIADLDLPASDIMTLEKITKSVQSVIRAESFSKGFALGAGLLKAGSEARTDMGKIIHYPTKESE
ncbi:hypothetical protein AGMMS49957_18550 [Synergistales bacterium]|nr:hypothetical protein AGMMS49957_18550 [Synergistales bacterium]